MLLLVACTEKETTQIVPPLLYSEPKTIAASPKGGYALNQLTGDTIKPIVLRGGDSLISGLAISKTGKRIHSDSIAIPKVVALVKPTTSINAFPSRHRIPNSLSVVTVNKESLKTVVLRDIDEDDSTHFILNYLGDTTFTGRPFATQGRVVKSKYPQRTPALPFRYKEDASKNIKYLNSDQGLANDVVLSLLEDSHGNLWFGTNGGGVSKYDGKSFWHFTEKEGLSADNIVGILEDRDGNLWFATTVLGVSKYDGEKFTHFTEKEGLSGNAVYSMLEDKSGNIWFGTSGAGVCKYDGSSITTYSVNEGLPHNSVWAIHEDKKGNLWFGTSIGASMFDGKTFTHYAENEGLTNSIITYILEDRNGNLWFGTWEGAFKFNGQSFTHFTENEGLTGNYVTSILEDKTGVIWFTGVGVSAFDGQSFSYFSTKDGMSYDVVRSAIEDKSGNIWFATDGGISKYQVKPFLSFTETEGLPNNNIVSILEDHRGYIWIGTNGGGVTKFDGETFTLYGENEGLPSNKILAILEDKDHNLWFGTDGDGVCKFDGISFTTYTLPGGWSYNRIRSIAEDHSGNLWFGTWIQGVCKFDGKTFTQYTEKEGFFGTNWAQLFEDKSNTLWFCSPRTLSRFDGKNVSYITDKQGLSNSAVISMLEDKDGVFWIATYGGGLCRYNEKTYTYITKKEGLSGNFIKNVVQDSEGNLWLSTENGLDKIILNDSSETPKFNSQGKLNSALKIINFTKEDGIKDLRFNSNTMTIDAKNQLWWGTQNSLSMLNLNLIPDALSAPKVTLNQIDLNGKFIDYRNAKNNAELEITESNIMPFENYPTNLVLPYSVNHISFNFNAIDWIAPHKIRYSYMMKGLNNNWSAPTNEGYADFRSLPYGTYTFIVRAIGESGQWGEALNYAITIRPPWWHTWWARTGYVLLFVFIVLGIIRWRTIRLIKRQIELEIEVDNATIEIKTQKQEVERERDRSESLLLNILPAEIAEELKEKGKADARDFELASILFTDFKGFTEQSAKLSASELLWEINFSFEAFDGIMDKYGIEKIKTIGDAYMAAGGLPVPTDDSVKNTVLAALEMQAFIISRKAKMDNEGKPAFEMRVGIHTGPVVAGIVGVKKFQYDIWGDTVNTASRMESAGEVGKVNISQATYELLKSDPDFAFESRGKIAAKGKGEMEMYFVSVTNNK